MSDRSGLRVRPSGRVSGGYHIDVLEFRRLLSGEVAGLSGGEIAPDEAPVLSEPAEDCGCLAGEDGGAAEQRVLYDPWDWGQNDQDFQPLTRWTTTANGGTGTTGRGIKLTWGVVPDGTTMPAGASTAAGPSNLIARMNAIYGSQANWQPIFQQVFDAWAVNSGVVYEFEPADDGVPVLDTNPGVLNVRADVRIGARGIDGSFGVLAFNPFANFGDMILDSFDLQPGGFLFGNTPALRATMMHEHGHGLGLAHVCPLAGTKLMEPLISTLHTTLPFDDMLGAQRQYGDRFEKGLGNSSHLTAPDLGNVNVGGPNVEVHQVSVSANDDLDHYKFTLTAPGAINATVSPAGSTYIQGPQDANCNTGVPYNPSAQTNLRLDLVNAAGVTLAQVNANGIGSSESLVNFGLPAGVYFIRVLNAPGSPNLLQHYSVAISAVPDTTPPTVTSSQYEFETQQRIVFSFSEFVQDSLEFADFSALNTTTSATFIPNALTYAPATNTVTATFAQILTDGNYLVTVDDRTVSDASGNPLTADGTLEFFVLGGDANRDRIVDIGDFAIMGSRFNQPGTFSQGNFDYAGLIDISDFAILAANFNESLPAPRAAVVTSLLTATGQVAAFSNQSINLLDRVDDDADRVDSGQSVLI